MKGYTPDKLEIVKENVSVDTKNQTIVIDYIENVAHVNLDGKIAHKYSQFLSLSDLKNIFQFQIMNLSFQNYRLMILIGIKMVSN
ncbi:hypothetical protein ACSLGP_05120 [Lactobacillus acidophilus]|uniref:hypothetical protein n=1 Tax=Lactobacillus acidophilus TaxID=1579 RepID=UPI003D3438E1